MHPRIAVSSWALHRTIGQARFDSPEDPDANVTVHAEPMFTIQDLPSEVAKRGISQFQLCHFHILDRDGLHLNSLAESARRAETRFHALLIDAGDITDPVHGDRDREWIRAWLGRAEAMGAERARVIAGKQAATPTTLTRAIVALRDLARSARVQIEVENWFPLLDTPRDVHFLLDELEGQVNLCADFGNWPRPRCYDDLPAILPRATTCHAKLEFLDKGHLDLEDADQHMKATQAAGFKGSYVIVNGGPGGLEWDAIELQRKFLASNVDQ